MSDVKKFPGMRWHPETAEMRVFDSVDDVPPRWLDYHPGAPLNLVPEDGPPPPEPKAPTLSRQQIIADLQRRGVVFQRNAATKALYELLVAEVERSEA